MGHLKIGLTTIFEAILRRLNKASGLNGPRKEVERILTAFQNRLWMWLRAAFHSGVQMVCVEVHQPCFAHHVQDQECACRDHGW